MARGLSIPRVNGLSLVWSFNMKGSLGNFTPDLGIYLEDPVKMYLNRAAVA